ncbi:MAG: hypothetical protein OZSIB_2739 [Candidatus Ozemobacter sibiricus]|jgi:hypothetical protein|uniref:Uncharacterized protein n=1 Tax=Candidatus Ozemobacter sibiricus TaxID=2268124 RepID=A0A367ZU42_9BACT|nr:MAG: hypothetical protein OZSIB_2739 [Candidatus Ozemobacter sibiricus]
MKMELMKALSFGTGTLDQSRATIQRTQEINRVRESLVKAGAGERARVSDAYVRSARDVRAAEQTRVESRQQQVSTASLQFGQVLRQSNAEVNKVMAALIASPMNGGQPAVQIGQLIDRFA